MTVPAGQPVLLVADADETSNDHFHAWSTACGNRLDCVISPPAGASEVTATFLD